METLNFTELIDFLDEQLSAKTLKKLGMKIDDIDTISVVGEINKNGLLLPIYEAKDKYKYSFKFYIWNGYVYFYDTKRYLIVVDSPNKREILECFDNLKDAQEELKRIFVGMVDEDPGNWGLCVLICRRNPERMRGVELSTTAPDGTRSITKDVYTYSIEIVNEDYLNDLNN